MLAKGEVAEPGLAEAEARDPVHDPGAGGEAQEVAQEPAEAVHRQRPHQARRDQEAHQAQSLHEAVIIFVNLDE